MINYTLIIAFAIIMGLLFNYFFILLYVNRLQEYFAKYQSKSNLVKLFDFFFRLSIPITFGAIGFLLPFKIIRYFSRGDIAEKLISIYIYVFVFSLFVCLLFLIKQGKIKYTKAS